MKLSKIGIGCMRIGDKTIEQVEDMISCAIDEGINFFDHADIYAKGESERKFGEALKRHKEWREKIYIQSKCGIVPGKCYEAGYDYIINQVSQILERLQCDYLDSLLIHRPDALMNPKDVARAFDDLYKQNKVKHFGVSNMNPMQIELLQKYCHQKLEFNQMQFSPVHSLIIDQGIYVNMVNQEACMREGSLKDYCALHDITIQCWSILREDLAHDTFIDNDAYPELNKVLDTLSQKYKVSKAAIVVAWILKLPQPILPLIGATSPKHIKEMTKGMHISLSHQEWYDIYLANRILP